MVPVPGAPAHNVPQPCARRTGWLRAAVLSWGADEEMVQNAILSAENELFGLSEHAHFVLS